MASDRTPDPATTIHFNVAIDEHELGRFTKCEGLGMEVEMEEYTEGGNLDFVHQLPGRVKYSNVKLTRPITPESQKISDWLASMSTAVTRSTGTIEALDPTHAGAFIVKWNLEGIVPVRWTGPQFTVDNAGIATETLEVAHIGFWVETPSPATSPSPAMGQN